MVDRHEDHGSDHRAIKPARTAQDQHDQRLGREREGKGFQADQLGDLRGQCAGHAGNGAANRIGHDPAPVDRRANRLHPFRAFVNAAQRQPKG